MVLLSRGAAGYNHRDFLSLPPHRAASARLCTHNPLLNSLWQSGSLHCAALGEPHWAQTLCLHCHGVLDSFTFSRWMSFLIWDILIFMASSSSSGTRGILGTASDSSTIWKLRSVSGMYHLQSYCWLFLKGSRSKPFTNILGKPSPSHKFLPAIVQKMQIPAQLYCDSHMENVWQQAAFQ